MATGHSRPMQVFSRFAGPAALLLLLAQPALPQPTGTVQNPFGRSPEAPPRSVPPVEAPRPPAFRKAPARPSDAEIAKKLIANSIADYDGPCACPYQQDRAGRSCGRRSAYNRPRGAAPLCFEKDVTAELIAAFRARH
jgi:hypothetical protein